MPRCDCNHMAHFRRSTGTPHGEPGHPFNELFDEHDLVRLPRETGGVRVCVDCALDCHAAELVNLLDCATMAAFITRTFPSEPRS